MRGFPWAPLLVCVAASCDGATPKIYGPVFDATPESAAPDGSLPMMDAMADAPAMDAGGCPGTTVLLAGSQSSLFGASRSGAGAFKTETLSGALVDRPALVALQNGFLGVLRASNDTVQSTVFGASFTDPAVVGSAVTRDAPALTIIGNVAHLVYQAKSANMSVDYKFFHGQFSNSAWDMASDPVGGSGPSQSYGPRAPSAAGVMNALVVVQGGDNSILYDQTWNGSWQMASPHPSAAVQKTITPAVVALTGGNEDLLVVYARDVDYKLMSTSRSGGNWSTPTLVDANAFLSGSTNEPVALAPMASGRAVMVYRGADSKPYFSIYDPSKTPAWTAPAALVSGANPSVDSLPSVAAGVCGADAVAAYVESGVGVKVTQLSSGMWSSPESVPMSSSAKYVAVATRP